jgi:Kef-type K+ transport system membrane component KefB/mannitol/fructose-specific phosphotransferase system IIA component (Ntr-type)
LTLPVTDPVLIVAISALIFLVAPLLMQAVRLPGMIGLILAGALIGPNALNLLDRSSTIILLGTVGLLYLMFLAGIDIDLHQFRRYRHRSIVFGALTFVLPQGIGTAVMLAVGYDLLTAVLIASMFASHTLVAYPIALRFGIGRSQAVTTAVGGTIITDTAALLVLSVIASSTRGEVDAAFWMRLPATLAIYFVVVWYGLPRLARWFFRSERTGAIAEYVFVFAALFAGAYLAELAGIEGIVGAFLVGLALNRLIPEQSVLANRIRFVGEAIFIPFFLLSIGMLVDVRVLFGSAHAWEVMIAMTATVSVTKWLAARAAGRLYGYSPAEWWTIFGLSVPQAAATLAATLIGIRIGLFDEAVLNGSVLMILVTCVLGPWVVERYGRQLALETELQPAGSGVVPQRMLVPMANPATADALLELALAVREGESREPLYALSVVPDGGDASLETIARAERMLSHAVQHAAAVDVQVRTIIRIDPNYATGIARGALETRTSVIIIGWDARRSTRQLIFGTVLDQLLEQTRQHVIVAKLGHPLNTTSRVVLLLARGSELIPGYSDALRTVKLVASRLGAALHVGVVGADADPYAAHLDARPPEVPVSVATVGSWRAAPEWLRGQVRRDDLVVLLSGRRGSIAWHPALARMPSLVAGLPAASFLVMYPSELNPVGSADAAAGELAQMLAPEDIVLNVPRIRFEDAVRHVLAAAAVADGARLHHIAAELVALEQNSSTELGAGVVAPHLVVPGLDMPRVLLGISPDGIDFPHSQTPAHVIFIVLTPDDEPEEHLRQLGAVTRVADDASRVAGLRGARSIAEVMHVLAQHG